MRSFEYYTPTRVIFCKDTHLKAGSLLKDEGCRKVLIHYGSGRAVASGLLEEVQNSLKEAGVDLSLWAASYPTPVSAKSVRELNSVKKKGWIFFWQLAEEALSIPAKPSATVLPILGQTCGISF